MKVVVELLGVPLSVRAAKLIKRLERVDMFDTGVSFNLFKLSTTYRRDQNRYDEQESEAVS